MPGQSMMFFPRTTASSPITPPNACASSGSNDAASAISAGIAVAKSSVRPAGFHVYA